MKAQKQRLYGGQRNFLLTRRYGITIEEVDRIINEQGLLCPLCLKRLPQHVDHDHATGAIRGILCFKCNGALGKFEDDPDRIRAAIEYLSRHDG
ncbi:MAG: endonuclease VII domain-containing protein [Actinomycetota bacterium]